MSLFPIESTEAYASSVARFAYGVGWCLSALGSGGTRANAVGVDRWCEEAQAERNRCDRRDDDEEYSNAHQHAGDDLCMEAGGIRIVSEREDTGGTQRECDQR